MAAASGNKQFVVFFLLVTVFLTAISIATALIMKETTTEFDVSTVQLEMESIVNQSANKIKEQEAAVNDLILSVETALQEVQAANQALMQSAMEAAMPTQ